MKHLRQYIRELILENQTINSFQSDVLSGSQSSQSSPALLMLQAMENQLAFTISPSSFNSTHHYAFEYHVMEECVYEIKLSTAFGDVLHISEIAAINFETEDHVYSDECEDKGYGTQIMKELISLADEYDVELSLEPSAFNQDNENKRPDTQGLVSWYQRLGFDWSPQDNGTMVYNFR